MAALATFAALALWAGSARSQGAAPSSVGVDRLRVVGGGRQSVWVSVLDREGVPVTGLEAKHFSVEHDGRRVEDLEVTPFGERYGSLHISLLCDADLLQNGSAWTGEMLEQLGRAAGPRDRVRVEALSKRAGAAEAAVADADRLREKLGHLGEERAAGNLYDVLYDAVSRAPVPGGGRASIVLVLTRGDESGSRRGVVDVLVRSRLAGEGLPIVVLLLTDGGVAGEEARLGSLAARSGGALLRVDGPAALPAAVARAVARARGAYSLSYRVRGWDPREERHTLSVTVEAGGARRSRQLDYVTADVVGAPWWQRPLPWVILVAVAIAGMTAFVVATRRRLCRLGVEGGVEDGCTYEIFALPVTLGAAVGNDLTFAEGRISRNHAVLERRGPGVELVDLNSENGTFVNGERINRRRLANGDRISLGGVFDLTYEGRG